MVTIYILLFFLYLLIAYQMNKLNKFKELYLNKLEHEQLNKLFIKKYFHINFYNNKWNVTPRMKPIKRKNQIVVVPFWEWEKEELTKEISKLKSEIERLEANYNDCERKS